MNQSGNNTYSLNPNLATFYNLSIKLGESWSSTTHLNILSDFTVVGSLSFNTNGGSGVVDNPSSARIITVFGDLTVTNIGVAGTNLTIIMTGSSKNISHVSGQIRCNIAIDGSISAATNISVDGSFVVNSEKTFSTAAYNLIVGSNVVNGGTLTGTSGTWTMNGDFTNGATGTVSAPTTWNVKKNFTNNGDIVSNSGSLIMGNGSYSGSPVYTFDSGSSDFYNVSFEPVHIQIIHILLLLDHSMFWEI